MTKKEKGFAVIGGSTGFILSVLLGGAIILVRNFGELFGVSVLGVGAPPYNLTVGAVVTGVIFVTMVGVMCGCRIPDLIRKR